MSKGGKKKLNKTNKQKKKISRVFWTRSPFAESSSERTWYFWFGLVPIHKKALFKITENWVEWRVRIKIKPLSELLLTVASDSCAWQIRVVRDALLGCCSPCSEMLFSSTRMYIVIWVTVDNPLTLTFDFYYLYLHDGVYIYIYIYCHVIGWLANCMNDQRQVFLIKYQMHGRCLTQIRREAIRCTLGRFFRLTKIRLERWKVYQINFRGM